MSDQRIGINVITQADTAQVERLTQRINDLRTAIRQLSNAGADSSGVGFRNLTQQLEGAQRQLGTLYEAMRHPPAAFASLPENAWPIQYARIVEQAKKETEALVRAQSGFASQVAPQTNIAAYRRETQAAARDVEALVNAQTAFASRVAPQSNIASQRRAEAQATREAVRATALYAAEQERLAAEQQAFASQIAPQTRIRYNVSSGGELQAVARDLQQITRDGETATIIGRKFVSLMDEGARGQRGAMFSTIASGMRDIVGAGPATIAVMGGIAALAGGAAIIRGAHALGELAQQTRIAATASGMSVEQFSELQGALRLMGLKSNEADESLRRLANSIGKAISEPSSEAAQAFRAFGISTEFLKANASSADVVLGALSSALKNYKNDANSAHALTEIFGRGFEKILPVLSQGGAKLDELRAQARQLGIVLSSEAEQALEDTSHRVDTLTVAIEGRAIQAFLKWKPAIDAVVDSLRRLVGGESDAEKAMDSLQRFEQGRGYVGGRGGLAPGESRDPGIGPIPEPYSIIQTQRGQSRQAIPAIDQPYDMKGMLEQLQANVAPSIGPIGGDASNYTKVVEAADQARNKAALQGGTLTQMILREAQAEVQVLKAADQTNMSLKERAQLAEKIATAETSLANKTEGAAEKGARAGAAAARQRYEAFVADEKNQLTAQEGNVANQKAILDEWTAHAKASFGEQSTEYKKAMAEIEKSAQGVQRQQTSAAVTGVREQVSNMELALRAFEEDNQMRTKEKGALHLSPVQAYKSDISEISTQYDAIRKQAAQLLTLPNLTAQQQQGIQQLQTHLELAENAAVATYQEKMAAASSKIGAVLQKELAGAFDKIGSGLEKYLTDAITKSTTAGKAGQQLLKSLVGSTVSGAGDIASQFGAKAIGGQPGQGLGQALSSKLFAMIPGIGDAGKEALQATQNATALTPVLEAQTAQLVTAITAAAQEETSATIAAGANPEILGNKFQFGGIVPSAAKGMIVPGTNGGQLSILHPREMVLPENISNHIVNSMTGGPSNFTYAPTMNGGAPFSGRTDAENFFRKHGSSMDQLARGWGRSR